ncbi:MAG: hypothetical protein QOF78_1830, partial [Phycisphaerales bacterium]|nr:hypothetical protein [Phycisphaerales bacterium]
DEVGLERQATAYGRLLDSFARELGPRMGQIELGTDGRPAKRSDRFSANAGSASNLLAVTRFRWLTFVDSFAGAPALARWLAEERKCREFRYEFEFRGDYLADDVGGAGAPAGAED